MRTSFKSFLLTESSWPKTKDQVWQRLNKYYDVLRDGSGNRIYDIPEDKVDIADDLSVSVELEASYYLRLKETKEQLPNLMVQFKHLDGSFTCAHVTSLLSLDGAPGTVTRNFDCYEAGITTVKGGPKEVLGTYNLTRTYIKSLEGLPTSLFKLIVSGTNIRNLTGAPETVNDLYAIECRWLNSLTGLPKTIKRAEIQYSSNLGLLRLPLSNIGDIKLVKPEDTIDDKLWNQIYQAVDDTLNGGRVGVLELQKRLLDLNLEKNARM